MKQLFVNNAKTTLASTLNVGDTALTVADGSKFPNPGAYEYFLCTVELSGSIEILMITARTGNTFTIGGFLAAGETVPGRGQEGSIAKAFTIGARVECRVTRDTLDRMSTSLSALTSVNNLVAPKDSYNEGYICGTFDPFNNPVLAVAKDDYSWRFLNYTSQYTKTVTSATTTSATCASITIGDVAAGKYLIQFTSGAQAGKVRQVTSVAANSVSWSTALEGAPVASDTFEVFKANASIIADALANLTFPISDAGGTSDAITATYASTASALVDNLTVLVVLAGANATATPTFSPNALTPKVITNNDGTPLEVGQISGTIMLRYDSTSDNWRLVATQAGVGVQPINYFIGNF